MFVEWEENIDIATFYFHAYYYINFDWTLYVYAPIGIQNNQDSILSSNNYQFYFSFSQCNIRYIYYIKFDQTKATPGRYLFGEIISCNSNDIQNNKCSFLIGRKGRLLEVHQLKSFNI